MNVKLLLISQKDFPPLLKGRLETEGYHPTEARGRLRIKELAKDTKFDAVVWLFEGIDEALALDLAEALNEQIFAPVLLLTSSFEKPSFASQMERLFTIKDINDGVEEIILTIEKTCKQALLTRKSEHQQVHEIDFKNKLGQMVGSKEPKSKNEAPLKLETPWVAVGQLEKSVLSHQEIQRGPIAEFFWGRKK
ncbi:MAG: hypothetical protein QNL04_10330 [SAR324 cluster bacterium]|nr:hypothetical protein [SAR324 cluster bacterium]